MHKTLSSRLIGYIASLILTLISFTIVLYPEALPLQMAIVLILILACVQAIVQSIFFLNVLSETGPRWNLIIFLSTLSIMLIIIIGAIWIMHHLDYNMMPDMNHSSTHS